MFCTSSHDVFHLCDFLSKYLKRFPTYKAARVHGKIAIFNIYYVQTVITPKVG